MTEITSGIDSDVKKLGIEDVDVSNKHVLLRTDFNVPMDDQNNITDDTRLRSVLPTINYLLDSGSKIIILSHLGRPKGKVNPKLTLAPVAKRLSRLLEKECAIAPEVIGSKAKKMVAEMEGSSILMLENVRFHPGEEEDNQEFAKEISDFGDI